MAEKALEERIGQLESQLARHEAQRKEIEAINNEWRDTLDALSDLVILVDATGRILRINRTAEMWGLGSVRELPDEPLHEALHPVCDDHDCYLREAWERLRSFGGESAPSGIVEREFEDWRLGRRIRLTARRIGERETLHGGGAFAVLVLRDVTVYYHRRVTRSRHRQLETMSHLVRGLAHEIGNPLAAVKMSAQVLKRSFDRFSREKQETYLERIASETDRIQAILDRVLKDHQWKVGPLVAVSTGKVLGGLAGLYGFEMEERGLEFEVETPSDPEPVIEGDPVALDTVLAIVLDNAMDACAGGDRVIVRCRADENRVRIEVRDTGCGMSQGDLERMFQPFFSTKSRGSGLGMSHANHLMEQMRGRLDIDSAEGEGTRVNLVFRRPVEGHVHPESGHPESGER